MEEKAELKIINMSEVQSQEIKWLWYPFIAYGKTSIVQGDPGDGKSTLILNIAARLSRDERLEPEMNIDKPVNVIYQTILDPIQAYLGGGTDMNRANEAREMTKNLGNIAERTGCAIVLIGHMNKGSGAKAAYRGMGSIDFFAVARSVMLVGRIEGQPDMRAVVQIKNNLAPFGHPKAFELTQDGFRWIGDYEITADEVLGGIVPKASKLEIAKQFLRDRSGANVMILSTEIIEQASQEGISKRTLEAAKKELKIDAKKINSRWYWDLGLKTDDVMA